MCCLWPTQFWEANQCISEQMMPLYCGKKVEQGQANFICDPIITYIIKYQMRVAYQGSMPKLVLRFQFVRTYINIYTCPLQRITSYVYELIDPMMVKGERATNGNLWQLFQFKWYFIAYVTHTFSFPGTNASGFTGLNSAPSVNYKVSIHLYCKVSYYRYTVKIVFK